jgi:hypothetical protein
MTHDSCHVRNVNETASPSPDLHPCCTPRSFQGFTCLMQLSSRTKDWVVDCLALRNHLGPALAPIFADPSVVKVSSLMLSEASGWQLFEAGSPTTW